MGLDSVQLLMDIENYFNIRIPDQEAERTLTIQDLTDSISKHVNVEKVVGLLNSSMFERLSLSLEKCGIANSKLAPSDKISVTMDPSKRNEWIAVEKELGLKIPKPHNSIFRLPFKKPNYDWQNLTIDQFIMGICAKNYKSLIDPKNIESKFEIQAVVVGITAANQGIDYYEIQPDKRFVHDLGIS